MNDMVLTAVQKEGTLTLSLAANVTRGVDADFCKARLQFSLLDDRLSGTAEVLPVFFKEARHDSGSAAGVSIEGELSLLEARLQ